MRSMRENGGVGSTLLSWLVIAVMAGGLSSCGGERPAARPSVDSAEDTTAHESVPPPPPADVVEQPPVAELPAYIIRGVCPFECCKYGGNWTLLQGGVLRSEPDSGSDSVGGVVSGATVHTDDGAMVLQPVGVATVVPDTSHTTGGPPIGDTVEVITYMRAKVARVRWHDQDLEMSWSGLRVTREPVQRWWVHMTDPVSGQAGWLLMTGGINAEEVGAPNACGGH
ncbi:MAG TPA: hypothetical protein VIV88_00400 [Gemmatimonadales bacterium]